MSRLDAFLADRPLIAILRGVRPEEVVDVVDVLVEHGIRIVEMPLNSPSPLVSIARIARHFGERIATGAGTVLHAAQVDEVQQAGGDIVIAPNFDADVVARARTLWLPPMPVWPADRGFLGGWRRRSTLITTAFGAINCDGAGCLVTLV